MSNITIASLASSTEMDTSTSVNAYTASEITLILGGIGGMIASLIYALKNVKHLKSGCCECDQKVSTPPQTPMPRPAPVTQL
jgi:hypothetical protein